MVLLVLAKPGAGGAGVADDDAGAGDAGVGERQGGLEPLASSSSP